MNVTDINEFRIRTLGAVAEDASLQFDELLDGLPDAVVYRLRVDADGKRTLIWVSKSIERVIGIAREAAMADFGIWMSALDPSDLPRLMEAEQGAVASGERFRLDLHPTIDGRRRTFQIAAKPNPVGHGAVVWDGTVVDVTDQRGESAERERLATMLKNTTDFVAVVDLATGGNVFLNDSFRRALAVPDDLDLSQVPIEHVHEPDEAKRILEEAVPAAIEHGTWSGETTIRAFDGTLRAVTAVLLCHRGADGRPTHVSTVMRDISKERAAAERARLLTRELNHRVKNLFAIVSGMVGLTARATRTPEEMADALRDRIHALASAHALIQPAITGEEIRTAKVTLQNLIASVIEPHVHEMEQVELAGPVVSLRAEAASSLALVLHELATNAAKHGALSTERGTLSVEWEVGGVAPSRALALTWAESGGPPLAGKPDRSGFGSTLIDMTMRAQMAGTVTTEWETGGAVHRLTIPLNRLQ